MKITIVSPFYPYRGGISDFSNVLFKTLQAKGHTVQALTFSKMYPNFLFPGKTQYVEADSEFTKIPTKRILNSINPFSYIKTAKFIKKDKPDVVIISYWMSFFIPAYSIITKLIKNNTKVIHLFHNIISHEPLFYDKWLLRLFMKQVSASIVLSKSVKQDLLVLKSDSKYLYSPHPLYNHFGNPIQKSQAKTQLGLDLNKKTLLFFGLIRDYKGLDLLIEAFGKLSSEYQLLVAGESYGSFDKYNELVNKLPNKQDVYIFNKYINDAEVPIFFSAADVCILPYRSATQSGITSISYHFDLPIIATNVGGLQEVIRDGENGIIVAPDSNGIESGIRRFFENDNIQRFKANIAKIKEELSWEKFADNIVDFSKTL